MSSMQIPRSVSLTIQYFLDEWIPPRLRDSKLLMKLPMVIVLRQHSLDFMTFKERFWSLSASEISELYLRTEAVQSLQGDTDLNRRGFERLVEEISDKSVLEVGCGRGLLAGTLSVDNAVTACDVVVPDVLGDRFPNVDFIEANIEGLPFEDGYFDCVVCTHTLEHVRDLPQALSELRRVARNDLYIVVPRQRPYRYTFSLHTQFFPYEWSIWNAFGFSENASLERLGDWYYHESIYAG